jgi:hypothetical protein
MEEESKAMEGVEMAEPIQRDDPMGVDSLKEEAKPTREEQQPAAINTHARLWDPIRDMRPPSEEEFSVQRRPIFIIDFGDRGLRLGLGGL